MVKKKDRNKSTSFILRDFNVELLDKLKKFTGEKTASKAVMLVCARYLGLEKLADKQKQEIENLNEVLDSVVCNLKKRNEANKNLDEFLNNMDWRLE